MIIWIHRIRDNRSGIIWCKFYSRQRSRRNNVGLLSSDQKTRVTKFTVKLNTWARESWTTRGLKWKFIGARSHGSNARRPAWTHAKLCTLRRPMNNEYRFSNTRSVPFPWPDLPAEGITNHAAMSTPSLIFIPRPSFSHFSRSIVVIPMFIGDSATVKLRYARWKLSWQNYATGAIT